MAAFVLERRHRADLVLRSAGSSANTMPTTSASDSANAITRPSTPMSIAIGTSIGGLKLAMACVATVARPIGDNAAAEKEDDGLSHELAYERGRPAPSATRTAISRRRRTARAIVTPARLPHATSRISREKLIRSAMKTRHAGARFGRHAAERVEVDAAPLGRPPDAPLRSALRCPRAHARRMCASAVGQAADELEGVVVARVEPQVGLA